MVVRGVILGYSRQARDAFLRLRVVVLGANIVALLEEIVTLFLELLRHVVAINESLTTIWKEQKRKEGVADQSVPQVGRPAVQKIEEV